MTNIASSAPSASSLRLLFVTKDSSVLQENSPTFLKIMDIRQVFPEVHVVLLNYKGTAHSESVRRLAEQVWVYQTCSRSWLQLFFDGYQLASTQLAFGGGFRADVVIADDVYEAGLVAWFIAKKYAKPFQLHIAEDFFDQTYVRKQRYPLLYEWSVRYVLTKVQSVLVHTEFQRQAIIQENQKLVKNTVLLPQYYDFHAWNNLTPVVDLHSKFPQFNFIILHISSMQEKSNSQQILDGTAKILRRYPTIGLIVVGSGPLRSILERHAIALGLQKQIEFLPMPNEVISYIKTANVFLHLSDEGSEDFLLLAAAICKTPVVANIHGLGSTVFMHGESAYLCDPRDAKCVADSINQYLNQNQNRVRFALNAHEAVAGHMKQDYVGYLTAYKHSIERCLDRDS